MKERDHRVRVTRMLLRRALCDLLRQKPLQNISIKEDVYKRQVESTAVGITLVSTPAAEMMGSATVKEHLPKPEISWMAATRFCGFI